MAETAASLLAPCARLTASTDNRSLAVFCAMRLKGRAHALDTGQPERRDRRGHKRPNHADRRTCPVCGGSLSFYEGLTLWRTDGGFEPGWICETGECGHREFVRRRSQEHQLPASTPAPAAPASATASGGEDVMKSRARAKQQPAARRNRRATTRREAPTLGCPVCGQPLTHVTVLAQPAGTPGAAKWAHLQCKGGCGVYQYRSASRTTSRQVKP